MKQPTKSTRIILIAVVVLLTLLAVKFCGTKQPPPQPQPQSTRASLAIRADVPRFYHGLGTVTALQDTIIRSRVDGYLTAIHFKEGQYVQQGDILVEIDPRPFQNKLAEAKGALVRDEALLKNAKQDLDRYRKLLRKDAVPVQQVQAQEALVGQYEGAVLQDRATIAEAELQLAYSRVTAPFAGRTGLRQVDIGATISSGDSNGIVRLTQTRPCYVVFTLIDKYLPHVREAMKAKASAGETGSAAAQNRLSVEIWSQDGNQLLSHGFLESLDNQIDASTGTIKAKALVPNDDDRLFPNQFVNVHLHVDTLYDVLTVPASAVQRSNTGFFVYTVIDNSARLRPVTIEFSNDELAVIASGVEEGDIVITDGVDNLRDGSLVTYALPDAPAKPEIAPQPEMMPSSEAQAPPPQKSTASHLQTSENLLPGNTAAQKPQATLNPPTT